jgi:hypothetical protein
MENKDLNTVKLVKYWIESSDDDYKMSFKQQCTPEFTSDWIHKLKELRQWIKKLISQ